MTDKLAERLRDDIRVQEDLKPDGHYNAHLLRDVLTALESLTLPQTERAGEMLGEEYAEANLAPVLTTNGPTGKRDKAAIRAITKALASVPEQDSWQPIETAPLDTKILAAEHIIDDLWTVWQVRVLPGGIISALTMKPINFGRDVGSPFMPTRWRHEPPPPAPQDRGASQEDGHLQNISLDAQDEEQRRGKYVPAMAKFARAETPQSIPSTCRIPPTGWWCSRPSGHEGPCHSVSH